MQQLRRSTATWSRRSATSCARRVDEAVARRGRPGADRARPGPRLRQARRAQLGAQRAPGRARRARAPRALRGQPQVLPRAVCSPAPTARRGRSTAARPRRSRPACWPWRPAPGASACTTCAAPPTRWPCGAPPAHRASPTTGGTPIERRDHPDRAAGPGSSRRLRLRARAGPGLRRRRDPRAGPGAGRRAATTSPTPCTTASWPSALVEVIAGEPVNLIETLADRLVDGLPRRRPGRRRRPSPCTSRRRPIPHELRRRGGHHPPRRATGDPGGALPRQQPRRPVRPPARLRGGPRRTAS